MIYIIILSVIVGALGLYYFFFKNLNFFKKHGIPCKPPIPLLGNMGPSLLRLQSIAELFKDITTYNMKPSTLAFDMTGPIIMIRDPELIKSITLKHFDMFPDHSNFIDEEQKKKYLKKYFNEMENNETKETDFFLNYPARRYLYWSNIQEIIDILALEIFLIH